MSRYRRSHVEDATFFFTANLANRNSQLLVDEYERLWCAIDTARARHPFHTLAYYVQPDHVHVIWKMPGGDADFSLRWSVIKRLFSSGLPASTVSQCKAAKREKAFCKDAFGNTRFVTLPIYSSTWITSITTPLNMGLPRLFTNGGTRRSTCICRTGGCQRIGVTNWMPMFPNEVSAYDAPRGHAALCPPRLLWCKNLLLMFFLIHARTRPAHDLARNLAIIYRKNAYLSPAAKRSLEILKTQA